MNGPKLPKELFMDIMMPPLQQQPSPAPWLVRANRIDLSRLVEEVLAQRPEAGVDQVVAHLAERRQVQASGIIVSMLLSKRQQHAVAEDETPTRLDEIRTLKQRLAEVRVPEWAGVL
jgi:hypothetical protein